MGRKWQATARADDRGCGAAFITIALSLTPAINNDCFSPLNLSHPHTLCTSSFFHRNSPATPGNTLKSKLCIVWWQVYLEFLLPEVPNTHTHTYLPPSFLDTVWLRMSLFRLYCCYTDYLHFSPVTPSPACCNCKISKLVSKQVKPGINKGVWDGRVWDISERTAVKVLLTFLRAGWHCATPNSCSNVNPHTAG